MMNSKFHNVLRISILLFVFSTSVFGLQITDIGSIEDSLYAPTSITVSENTIAVLEPFSKQLKIFTSNGVILNKVDFNGETNSLCQLSESEYLFCDVEKNQVTYLNIDDKNQANYFENSYTFSNPTDIIKVDNNLFILDADLKLIIAFDLNKNYLASYPLRDNSSNEINFAGSFAYNPMSKQFFVFDQINSKTWVFSSDGLFVSTFGSYGANDGQITRGGEIICNKDGLTFISDRFQNRISIFNADGIFIQNIEANDSMSTSFSIPTGLAIDDNGVLYVVSTNSSKISMFFIGRYQKPTQTILPETFLPAEFDTVSVNNIKFIALAETMDTNSIVTGFDFQLFDNQNESIPIHQIDSIIPTSIYDSVSAMHTFEGVWELKDTLEINHNYAWRSKVHYNNRSSEWSSLIQFSTTTLPNEFKLYQNYPNPFNPNTTISFNLPTNTQAKLEIINLLGQSVITLFDDKLDAGFHDIVWDGRNQSGNMVASGIYFYRLSTNENSKSKKLVLLK